MSNPNATYQSPLGGRYASPAMLRLFSNDTRYGLWRRLWVALAETEMELGLPVTQEQVDELRAHVDDIDYACVAEKEKEIRHDVMAHVYAYGVVCPKAKGIIHLGATSCYVTDNADVLILQAGPGDPAPQDGQGPAEPARTSPRNTAPCRPWAIRTYSPPSP